MTHLSSPQPFGTSQVTMSSRKRQKQHNVPSRKRTRLGDISNSSYHKSQADTCIPSSPKCCINQHVPENEPQLESMDTSMYCSENVDFLPITRKQLARMKKFQRLDPGGLFNSLPPEVLHKLFSMLDPESMLSLCLTSTVLISYVQGYVYTSAGLSHILPPLVTNDMDTVSKRNFNLLGEFIFNFVYFIIIIKLFSHCRNDNKSSDSNGYLQEQAQSCSFLHRQGKQLLLRKYCPV